MSSEGWFTELDKYDRNGNILSQEIALDGDVDSRSYSLCGNRVASLTINGVEMGMAEYDSRGNITKIPGKDLQIVYNLCNLPRSITTGDGTTVNYSYLSDGTKILAVSDNGEKFLYAGSLRLKLGDAWAIPESFAIAGGRVTNKNGCWLTEYYITDHLGSVRAVVDGEGNTLATFDYTPYGELLAAADSTAAGNDYLFAGKEQQGKLGASELYDSQARFMATDGRFLSIDPLAENYYHLSPYAYCASDPVNLVDPDGRRIYFAEGVPNWVKQRYNATIEYMKEKYKSDVEDIIAVIGPSIGPCCFEVKEDVKKQFVDTFSEQVIAENKVDLWIANKFQLLNCGLKEENIECMNICTCCNDDKFYSYRKGDVEEGRFSAFIMLK